MHIKEEKNYQKWIIKIGISSLMWDEKVLQSFQQIMPYKLDFQIKLFLNAASCQTTDSTDSVRILIESELKDIKTTSSESSTKNAMELRNIKKCAKII